MTTLDRHPTARPFDRVRRRSARTAGLGLLAMALLAIPASLGLGSADGDAVRAAAACFVVIALLDVVVAVSLQRFLRPESAGWARAAGWSRTGYGVGFAVVAGLLAVDPGPAAVEQFQDRWDLLLVLFGAHLLTVAVALSVRRTAPVPVALATSLAGAAYLADEVGGWLFPDVSLRFLVPLMLGELVLTGWLLLRSREPARRRPA